MKKFLKIISSVAVSFALPFIVLALVAHYITTNSSEGSKNATLHSEEQLELEAWEGAKEIVKEHLKCPSTAKFTKYGEREDRPSVVSRGFWYDVSGFVDSQNGFGAMVRNRFTLNIRKDGEVWKITGELMFNNPYYFSSEGMRKHGDSKWRPGNNLKE